MLPNLKIGVDGFKPIYIRGDDRYKSIFIGGSTGVGKTELMKYLFQQDSCFNIAKIGIEPSGFLARDMYSIMKGKAHYCSVYNSLSINPLTAPYSPYQHADNILEVINQVVTSETSGDRFTPKMWSFLSKSIVWNLENGRKNLMLVRNSIAKWKEKSSVADKMTIDGILYRLDLLLDDKSLEQMLCGENPVSIEKLIEKGQSFILDCHGMSEPKMVFIGTLITHALKSYFRYSLKREYKPCVVYVDECQHFINPNWLSIIKEGRRYSFSAVLSTQDKANIDQTLFDTIMSNVGSIICFRVGYKEAYRIGNEFSTLDTNDLLTLPKYHFAYKTPDGEGIAKSRRVLPFREYEPEAKSFNVKSKGWFPLKPYRSSDTHIGTGAVAGEAES